MRRSIAGDGLKRHVPILHWLPAYRSPWLGGDLLAGLTTAAIVIPQAMAYATMAGLPVQVGLYASLTPMVVYALLGTSRVLSVSVTSTISLLTASVLVAAVPSADPGRILVAAGTLALMVGLVLVVAGILRLGFLANFISTPVLAGFKTGIGVVIVVGQIGKALGFSVPQGGFVETVIDTIRGLDGTKWAAISITLLVLATLAWLPGLSRRLPAPLVAVAAAIIAAAFLDRTGADVKLVAKVPSGLPGFRMPDLSLWRALLPGALGIALMSFTESIAACRAFSEQGDPVVDADQELVALGMANLAGGLFQAYPGGGGTSQTAVNREAGAKTQVAALTTALTVAATLLVLAPLVSRIPEPALAALLIAAAAGLIDAAEFRAIGRYRATELVWALVAFGGVVLLGTLEGILVAVGLSLLMLLHSANHPPAYAMGRKRGTDIYRSLEEHPDDETFPGLLILRTEGGMNFASAPSVRQKLRRLVLESEPRVVILECSAIRDIEYTALMVLVEAERRLAGEGVTLWLSGLNPAPLKRIRPSPLGQTLGDDRMFPDLQQAVTSYLGQI